MKKRILAGLTLTGVAILASCSQDVTTSTLAPAAPSYLKAPACSFSTANNDARAYFADNKDAAFALLDAMATAYKAGDATNAGFAVLARIGVAANNGASQVKGTPTLGNTLVNDVLLCMNGFPTNINFTSALGPTGLFGVRSGGTSTPVIARNLNANGALIVGAPLYGAEPYTRGYPSVPPAAPIPAPTWPFTGQVLFYGNQLGGSSIGGQTAAGVLFDLKTMPVVAFSSPIRVGVCDVDNLSARTLHKHVVNATKTDTVIVAPAGIPQFCDLTPPLSAFRGFTQMLASVFAPKPLYAFVRSGGGAGLVDGLSEFGPVNFTDSLAFQGTIPNAALSDTAKAFDDSLTTSQFKPIITVRAVSKGGKVPLAGVKLTLSIYNNSGSWVPAPDSMSTAITNASGFATFPNYYIDKPGGYQVTVKSEFGPASAVTSNPFNINGQ